MQFLYKFRKWLMLPGVVFCIVVAAIFILRCKYLAEEAKAEEAIKIEILNSQEYKTAVRYCEALNCGKAIPYYKQLLYDIYKKQQSGTILEYWIKGKIGDCCSKSGKKDEAEEYLMEAKKGIENVTYNRRNDSLYADIYHAVGDYYIWEGEYESGLANYEAELQYASDDELTETYRAMALAYAILQKDKHAKRYYERAVKMGEKQKDYASLVRVYQDAAGFWVSKGDLEKAKEALEKGNEYAEACWGPGSVWEAHLYRIFAFISEYEKKSEK